MPGTRLSPLDASFLEVESPTAHMHVGWAAVLSPPAGRPPPTFDQLRAHVAARLCRAPRYRQKLLPVPLGLNDPVWVDDADFDLDRHVLPADATDLAEVIDAAMSAPLRRDRPLWELRIAERLADGRLAVVGKAHHCMVDGLAAVELAALLLDPTPDPAPPEPDGWRPARPPGMTGLLAGAVLDRVRHELDLVRLPIRLARSPARIFGFAEDAQRAARALSNSFSPAAVATPFNQPISPRRHLATLKRPLDDLRQIKCGFRTTINDVVLAAASGGVRRFLKRRGRRPVRLKAMVPVSVRGDGEAGALGNRISFIFISLPCDEPDPVRRLREVHMVTAERKQAGEPQGAEAVLKAVSYAPHAFQRALARLVASPRSFNMVVSNIPGPVEPLYMLGCKLEEAYPVVPIADRHGISIGLTTVGDGAFFGLYADRESLPDADLLAWGIDESIDELLELSRKAAEPEPALTV